MNTEFDPIEILRELCALKSLKDIAGKTEDYQRRQPRAWDRAFMAIAQAPSPTPAAHSADVIKSVTNCPTCGAECTVEGKTTHHYVPVVHSADGLLEALKACMAYIPGSEVRNWPPGHQLKKEALRLGHEAIANTRHKGAGWISVLDRRPERNQRVLFWHKPPAGSGPHGYPAIADEWNDDHHLRYASHWKPIYDPAAPGQEGAG